MSTEDKSAGKLKAVLDFTATAFMLAASAGLLWYVFQLGTPTGRRAATAVGPLPTAPVNLKGSYLTGSPTAPLVVIEFADFQCPFCAQFARETFPTLEAEFVRTGKVQWAFHDLPLPGHTRAPFAAVAADCAASQGLFWQMHDYLFSHQQDLSDSVLQAAPPAVGLEPRSYTSCLTRALGIEEGSRAVADAMRSLAIRGTPSFFIGRRLDQESVKITRRLAGAKAATDFEAALR